MSAGARNAPSGAWNGATPAECFDSGYAAPLPQKPRRSSRLSLDVEVFSRMAGRQSYKVRIFDASPYGCKIEFVERPSLHDQMLVKFDGLEPLAAAVCWVQDFVGGIEFDRPIHPAVFQSLVSGRETPK